MSSSDGPGHLLSLKVMRVSRPSLATAWQPFYSSSPSFSAHSTASILSLQGKTPLPGHPKTLRDLTHATELLTLPSAFGSIQLGETFSSCVCINNETSVGVEGVSMKVEMQTATSKVTLVEIGGSECNLVAGDTLENVVHHEIKELGQHVLGCTVSYRLPPGTRRTPGPAEDSSDPTLQVFRKFYKFAVTNPLGVKTKVHTPRSPSAMLSATEREKVFLEIHIQNLTQDAIWIEKMLFECAEDWTVQHDSGSDIFSGSAALMQPQDTRQYIYTCSPVKIHSPPVNYAPGAVIPLGRLDILWRSPFGEPGRLLTSMLSRRIPLPMAPAQQPASALPPYLKRNAPAPSAVPSRPRSPQLNQSRPSSPPPGQRPGSPFRVRTSLNQVRSQSPGPNISVNPPPATAHNVDVDLVVDAIPRDSIAVHKPFRVSCTLTVLASAPSKATQERALSLVVQHVQAPRVTHPTTNPVLAPGSFSPRLPSSGFSTPSPTSARRGVFNYALAHQKLLDAERRPLGTPDDELESDFVSVNLPRPVADGPDELALQRSSGVVFLGSSTTFLKPIRLSQSSSQDLDDQASRDNGVLGNVTEGSPDTKKASAVRQLDLSYLPMRSGFQTVGGLRVLLVEDKIVDRDESDPSREGETPQRQGEARILKEWDILAEIWVNS